MVGRLPTQTPNDTRIIENDRECFECGYALRGLKIGGKCPECGTIIPKSTFRDHPFCMMPPEVIRRLTTGAIAAAACVLIGGGILWCAFLGFIPMTWGKVGMACMAPFWVVAVFMLTPHVYVPEGVMRGLTRRSMLRKLARWLQLAILPIAAIAIVRTIDFNLKSEVIELLSMVNIALYVVFAVGLVILALMLERLADWVRDDSAEKLFLYSEWTVPIGLLILASVKPGLVGMILSLIATIGIFILPLGIISLAKSMALSVEHRRDHLEREKRRAQRRAREQAEADRRIAGMRAPAGSPPVRPARPSTHQ